MKPTHRSRLARQQTRQLQEALSDLRVPARPGNGWIDAIRSALSMTKTQLAKRMGIARPSIHQLEVNEVSGSITIASLQKAAAALGCEFKYVLEPKMPLPEMVNQQALHRARQKLGRVNQSQALEASALEAKNLADAINDLAKELEVRRPTDLWNE